MVAIEKKLLALQAWVVGGTIALGLLAASAVGLALYVSAESNDRIRRESRESNQAIACYVLPQIERARLTLPSTAYYKQNPDELRDQLVLLDEQETTAIDTWGDCPKKLSN